MKQHLMTLVIAAFGVAGAEATAPAPTVNVPLPGTVPASVTRAGADALAAFLGAGGQVQLLAADGTVVGTLNPDGTVALAGNATLADARAVQVVPPAGQGEAATYSLARDLSRPGAIKLEVVGPNGKTLALPLSALVNRQAGMKSGGDDAASKAEEASGEKAEKPEKPGKGKGGKGK